MRRTFLALPLLLALTGCGTVSVFQGGTSITANVQNPVTPDMLFAVENGLIAVLDGLVAYKRQCVAGRLDPSCTGVIARIQTYTRKIKPVLVDLRKFIRNNDQVSAIAAFRAAQQIMADIQGQALAAGVQ